MEDVNWNHLWAGRLVLVTNIMKAKQPNSILALTAPLWVNNTGPKGQDGGTLLKSHSQSLTHSEAQIRI